MRIKDVLRFWHLFFSVMQGFNGSKSPNLSAAWGQKSSQYPQPGRAVPGPARSPGLCSGRWRSRARVIMGDTRIPAHRVSSVGPDRVWHTVAFQPYQELLWEPVNTEYWLLNSDNKTEKQDNNHSGTETKNLATDWDVLWEKITVIEN